MPGCEITVRSSPGSAAAGRTPSQRPASSSRTSERSAKRSPWYERKRRVCRKVALSAPAQNASQRSTSSGVNARARIVASGLEQLGDADAGAAEVVAVVEEPGAAAGRDLGAVGDRVAVPFAGADVEAEPGVVALPGLAVQRAGEAEAVARRVSPAHRVMHPPAVGVAHHPGPAEAVL